MSQIAEYKRKFNRNKTIAQSIAMAEVRRTIKNLFDASDELYTMVERHLSEPGLTGRVSWDRCLAVLCVLEADKETTGYLSTHIEEGTLTLPSLGDQLLKQLTADGLLISRGRIIGMSERVEAADSAETEAEAA